MWLEMCSRRSLLRVRSEPHPQGWLGEQCLLTLILLNLLGHTRVADVAHLEADPGLCELVRCYQPRLYGLRRGRMEKRFCGQRKRTFPPDRSLLDWLSRPQHGTCTSLHTSGTASHLVRHKPNFPRGAEKWQLFEELRGFVHGFFR